MLLIVGANSEIGSVTARLLRSRGESVVATTRRSSAASDEVSLDFDKPVEDFVIPPRVSSACLCVAVARLAECAADPIRSARINVDQIVALIDRFVAKGIYSLFLSTNQVFNGERAHIPAEAPLSPVSEYGRQKARTELLLRERMARGAPIGILRLAKVVSPGMALIDGWRNELAAGRPIQAFADMTMAPVPIDVVAMAIVHMMQDRATVIAQLTGPRDVAYSEIGCFLAEQVGADPGLVRHVIALEHGMPVGATPRNTTLDSSYLADRYGLAVPDVLEVISRL